MNASATSAMPAMEPIAKVENRSKFVTFLYLSVSAAQSNSQWKIAISVTVSFTLVAFVIVVAVVYAHSKAFRKNDLASDCTEPSDEWEINSGDMTLLEKLGDGFFGVVYKAYLYNSQSRPMSMLARKKGNSFGDEKSVVARKKLKGEL